MNWKQHHNSAHTLALKISVFTFLLAYFFQHNYLPVSSTQLQITLLHHYLQLCSTPLHIYTTSSRSSHLLLDIQINSKSWLLAYYKTSTQSIVLSLWSLIILSFQFHTFCPPENSIDSELCTKRLYFFRILKLEVQDRG